MTHGDAIDRYLAEVARRLPGGAHTRRDILDELRDGLTESLSDDRPATGEQAATRLVREFGEPGAVGAALAGEVRIRLARRHAVRVLVLFVAAALGWQAYYTLVGVPEAVVPPGAAGTRFLAGIDVLRACATVAQVGAGLLAVLVSVRQLERLAAVWRLPLLLAAVTLAATTGFGGAALVMVASAAPGYQFPLALVGAPVVAVAALAALGAYRALRHLAAAA